MNDIVKAWTEIVTLPTYKTGAVDTNPLFLENRVYQGSSGNVYPYGVIDSISDIKVDQDYQAVFIENEFIKVMLLPELGGRIHRAYDKTRQRDFVYYNEVVKPALVGLLGPWISGGIEFNWPQHHRPTTYMPTDFTIEQHDDGSVTVWMGEVEHMYGLQVMAGFKLYPNKALIEITGKIYNGNETPRQFLWWSNPAVKGGDDHQSIFPPDVTAVYDHGKRDVSKFPIATGEYYKVDYSPGTDISRYKNLPVPTSYMADKSDYDFVGAYSHDEQGGLLHIANHHISPGKKQWSWGNCDFGLAWDRNLTDENGPYIELMTGVYTDNQPDFTWLDSHEEKTFVQNFLPYSDLGQIQNANTDLALKLERDGCKLVWGIYAISDLDSYHVTIENAAGILHQEVISLAPTASILNTLDYADESRVTMTVSSADGFRILSYEEHLATGEPTPDPADEPTKPSDTPSVEELYFIGQHLEQYHHATRNPVDYYQEGLRRDPLNYNCNLAMATLAYDGADFEAAIRYADNALARAHKLNKNPICGKASYIRGCAYEKVGDLTKAYSNLFKSTWSGNCKDSGFAAAARVAYKQGNLLEALDNVNRSLQLNGVNYQAATLKALLLAKLQRTEEALCFIEEHLKVQPLGYGLHFQRYRITQQSDDLQRFKSVMNQRDVNAIHLANFYLSVGDKEAARTLFEICQTAGAMAAYYKAFLSEEKSVDPQQLIRQFDENVLFPNTLTEVMVLQAFPDDYFANYLLGCFNYAKKNYDLAIKHWQKSLTLNAEFAPVYRNLSVYYFNKQKDSAQALELMERAFKLVSNDARVLFELDFLRKASGVNPRSRLSLLQEQKELVLIRDDLTAELLNLMNICGEIEAADSLLSKRIYHPWEGGEGRITGQYIINKIRFALRAMDNEDYCSAVESLEQALDYPLNLGEGRLVGQTDNDVHYLLAECYQRAGNQDLAEHHLSKAIAGQQEIGQSKYYNDQPADYLFYQALAHHKQGNSVLAGEIFQQMVDWAESNSNVDVEPDFFAVSLPDLVVFDNDLVAGNKAHCQFVKVMGLLGKAVLKPQSVNEYDKEMEKMTVLAPDHSKAQLIETFSQSLINESALS
ncbi:hypothetical protein RJ45_21375 [Photobacterium gaetbulicola]|uniref:DUF5107 domain-containing protein n=1 Tax=Photobacterium gaetbulicola TaxID=1295392 RepID=A0A0B9GYF4_9GAMM|nr:DUF5107 domain-containing protein [Photobacterium gaetbulicola]KHT61667.1 hypothetical protein RJ45_21375 [Photobacterium gaetbulicola]